MPKKQATKKKKLTPKTTRSVVTSDQPLLTARQLFKQSMSTLWQHKKLFAGLLTTIGLAQLLVVEGIVRTDFVAMNQQVRDLVGSGAFGLGSGALSYVYLLSSASQANGAGLIQSFFTILTILALLWTLREVTAGRAPRIRDTFYKSTYPLVPFTLVVLWLGVQLLPALVGAWLYSVVTANGIAVHLYEQAVWLAVFIALTAVSVRFVLGTIFALVIATLPDMAPWTAIKSGKNLVQGRRLWILRKLLFIGAVLLLLTTLIILPTIIVAPVIVPLLFYAMTLLSLAVIVAYMYGLYRELLK